MLNNYTQPRYAYTYKACIHPDGDFFILARYYGADLWLRDNESGDYAYHSTIGSSLGIYRSCALSREVIVLGDYRNNVIFSLYHPEAEIEDSVEYGRKIEV